MSRYKKIIIFTGVLILLLVVLAVSVIFFVDAGVYRTRLQAVASEVLGMEVSINGQLGIGFYPGMRLIMKDVHIRNRGKELVSAEKVRMGLELLPLLQGDVRITSVSLMRPKITLEQGVDGRYNFERPHTSKASSPAISLAMITLSNARFLYADKRSGGEIDTEDCSLKLRNLLLTGKVTDAIKYFSFTASLHCAKIRVNGRNMSNLELSASAGKGVYDFKPIKLEIFGGEGSGDVQADYSGVNPHYHVRFAVPQFRIEELVKTQSQKRVLEGSMAFTMNLSLHGRSTQQLKQSAFGDISLRGSGLKLNGYDLDKKFSQYESSQDFSLMDMGALLVAGPAGMALTKGYDFASVLSGSGGVSDIPSLVSLWKVKSGVMHAQDVAMATKGHRMAFLGGLDIVHDSFVDVTLALINQKGCAEVQQNISGQFNKPDIQQPSILKSVAGPVLNLLKKGRKMLPGGECDVIYTGSVDAPR